MILADLYLFVILNQKKSVTGAKEVSSVSFESHDQALSHFDTQPTIIVFNEGSKVTGVVSLLLL
jgi:hypothetical protein